MAIEPHYISSDTVSRKVVLVDHSIEQYEEIDVRDAMGVEFMVHLVCENYGDTVIDIGCGFYGGIEIVKFDPDTLDDPDYILDLEQIWYAEVEFNHVQDPEHWDVTQDESWNNLAMDVVEWYLREKDKTKEVPVNHPVQRNSRYNRPPVI